MISVGHRRKKIEVKLVKIGPLIDNIIIIIIIIIIITMMMMMIITIITMGFPIVGALHQHSYRHVHILCADLARTDVWRLFLNVTEGRS